MNTNAEKGAAGPKNWSAWVLGGWLMLWYCASLSLLILNKTILSELGATSHQLGCLQMVATSIFGGVKVFSNTLKEKNDGIRSQSESPFSRQIRSTLLVLALLRSSSVVLGLVSLKHVPASFTETIKSTAPLFTVYFQHILLGMRTSPQVLCSLLPVMIGLVVCAHAEISFNALGFWAAVLNNIVDCLQNVVSKKVLAKVTPIRLQFYTSVLAIFVQIPFILYNDANYVLRYDINALGDIFRTDAPQRQRNHVGAFYHTVLETSNTTAVISQQFSNNSSSSFSQRRVTVVTAHHFALKYYLFFAADLISYHLQSVSAYFVVATISPVSMSVANTLKRSVLIALSIAYFGNQISSLSIFGVFIVIAGVCLYNQARTLYPAPTPHTQLSQNQTTQGLPAVSSSNGGIQPNQHNPEDNNADVGLPLFEHNNKPSSPQAGPLQHLHHHPHHQSRI